mmetsp:Transcript_21544/g.43259  ORF Transcript_21544/g.43259 Transcript_21544/m.43259 type:complete len:204 (+) Transcript_21544:334-945(+)
MASLSALWIWYLSQYPEVLSMVNVSFTPNAYSGTRVALCLSAILTNPSLPRITQRSFPFSVCNTSASPPMTIPMFLSLERALSTLFRVASRCPVHRRYSRKIGTLNITVAPHGWMERPGKRFSRGDSDAYRTIPPYGKIPWGWTPNRNFFEASSLMSSSHSRDMSKYLMATFGSTPFLISGHSHLPVYSAPEKSVSAYIPTIG